MVKQIITFVLLQSVSSDYFERDQDINYVFPASELPHSPSDYPAEKYLGQFKNCSCFATSDVMTICSGRSCKEFPRLRVNVPLFSLKLTSIVTIRKDDLRNLSDIKSLEILDNVLLTTIEPGCFRNMSNLQNLTIFDNVKLKYLDVNVFEGLFNLKKLFLSKNGFRHVIDITKALSPIYLPNLEILDLSQNFFHSIEENEFHPMNHTKLQQLTLYGCGIFFMHPNSLEPFWNLTILRIGQNLFNKTIITNLIVQTIELGLPLDLLNLLNIGLRRQVPLRLLEAVGRSNISDIVLAQNHFNDITDDFFPYMPNLSIMDLRECQIETISDNAFARLTNLTILLLNLNGLTLVPQGTLSPLLIILDLAGNSNFMHPFFFIQDRIFENLTSLFSLQLGYNNIEYISNETLVGLYNLSILNLKNTNLNYIADGSFIHTPNLILLNLINNPLLVLMPITANTFMGLVSLRSILFGHCGINNLTATPSIFYHMKNLTFIGLDNNDLRSITPDQFTHLSSLHTIHLENNKLVPWNNKILPKNEFKAIYASQNKFTYITSSMLEDFQTASILDLDGNPFRCDCSLYPVAVWLRYNKMKLLYTEEKNFVAKCDNSEFWRKKSILTFLRYLNANTNECESVLSTTQIILIAVFLVLILMLAMLVYLFRWYIRYWIFLSKLNYLRRKVWVQCPKPKDDNQYTYDAFVSYSVEDRKWVQQLVEQLEPNLRLCLFERDFPLGASISQAVLQAVVTSRRTLLVVSEAFAKSHWCRWETQLAEFHQLFFQADSVAGPDDTLLIVRLHPVPSKFLTPTLRYLMKSRIYLEWPTNPTKQPSFWNKLRNAVAASKGEAENIA